MDLVIALIFYTISFIMYKINRKIINPLFLMPFLWANILLLYNLIPHTLYALQSQFLTAIFLWVISFVSGGFLIYYGLERLSEIKAKILNDHIVKVYYWIVIVFAPLTIYLLIVEALRADIQYLFVMLRGLNMGVEKMETPLGVLNYIFNFTFAALLLKVQDYDDSKKGERKKLNILILMNVLLCVVTVARTSFIFLGLSVFVILLLNGKIKRKHYFISFALLVFIMGLMTFIRSVVSFDEEEMTLANTIALYLFGGLPAFDTVTVDCYGQFGSNVFRFFYVILNAFGGSYTVNETIYDYVNIPVSTNVYTILYPFFRDFGYYGIIIFGFIYGFIFQSLYKFALKKYKIAQLIFAYLFPMLIMQFMGELLFTNLSIFLQMIIFFSIPYFFKIRL